MRPENKTHEDRVLDAIANSMTAEEQYNKQGGLTQLQEDAFMTKSLPTLITVAKRYHRNMDVMAWHKYDVAFWFTIGFFLGVFIARFFV